MTFKQRADLPPAGDAPLAGVLAQSGLQEEHGNTTRKEEDQVGDEEGTWMEQRQSFSSKTVETENPVRLYLTFKGERST